MTENFEPEENRKRMEIPKEDQPIVLPESICISLDFEKASGRFSRQGLSWFAQMLFLKDQAQNPDELSLTINGYYSYASQILKDSVLAEGLDIYNEEDGKEFDNRLIANKNSSEWWAAWLIKEINSLIDNPKREDKEIQSALWEMNRLTTFHSMLIFKQMLEPTTWSGYMISNLKNILRAWQENKETSCERFWQKLFEENSIVLSQVFSYPIILLQDSAYTGGKKLDNTGGRLVDFLLINNLSQNTALVEIKTPTTNLLDAPAKMYRNGIYNISTEITGAILQVSNYKDSFVKDYYRLNSESGKTFYAFNPQCMVIAGTLETEITDPMQAKTFELYRNGLKDVQLITYDELFRKIQILIDLLEG